MTGVIAMWLLMCLPMFFWPGCPCCGGGEELECEPCETMSECWEMTVAGVTDNTCTLCTNFNGTFTLRRQESCSDCRFTSDESFNSQRKNAFSVCTLAGIKWMMERLPSDLTKWHLSITSATSICNASTYPLYTLDNASFDCEGPNTFTFVSASSNECNWPATITVEPITCP